MKSIKSILAMLDESDRRTLQYAFENEIANTYVVYEPGRFIGVRINLSTLRVEQEAGLYAEGTLISGSNGHP